MHGPRIYGKYVNFRFLSALIVALSRFGFYETEHGLKLLPQVQAGIAIHSLYEQLDVYTHL